MGSKGNKPHQSIALAPTQTLPDPAASAAVSQPGPVEVVSSGEIDGGISVGVYAGALGGGGLGTIAPPASPPPVVPPEELPEWHEEFNAAAAGWATIADDPNATIHEKYAALQDYGVAARAALKEAQGEPGGDALFASLKEDTGAFFDGLTKAEVDELAAAAGFEHPILASKESVSFWLDPAYSPHLPQKAKIQGAAHNRYQQLLSGSIPDYKGITLADVQAATAVSGPGATWTATPAEFADLTSQLEALTASPGVYAPATSRAQAILLENQIVSAAVPDMAADDLAVAKAAATDKTTQLLNGPGGYSPSVSKALHDAGALTADQAYLLGNDDAVTLARLSSPAATAAELHDKVTENRQLADDYLQKVAGADMGAANAAMSGSAGIDLSTVAGKAQFAQALGDAQAAAAAADKLNESVMGTIPKWFSSATPFQHPDLAGSWPFPTFPKSQQQGFRNWAKDQPLPALRDIAGTAGLVDPDKAATRADVQNYLLAAVSLNGETAALKIQEGVDTKATQKKIPKPKPVPAAAPSAAPPAPSAAPPLTAAAVAAAAKPGTHTAKLKLMQQRLAAYGAAAKAVPARIDDSDIAGLGFTDAPTSQQVPGGSHTKVTVVDEAGNRWLHKKGQPAQAEAEVAASQVFAAAGVAAPPVYRHHYSGISGTVQPVVEGYSTLGAPSDLAQTDVDIVVRTMVVSWAIGDNDANEQNFVRTPPTATPTGEMVTGIVKIDNGQAGKFFGDPNEQLSTGWQPNSNYGTPLIHQVVSAAPSGGLADGVRVDATAAVPVIKAISALSDDEWRSMMRPVAEAGAADSHTPWRPRMVERVAARTGKPESQVTNHDIAEEFLAFAVDRKHSTRDDVVAYFEENGVDTTPIVTTT